MRKIFEFKNLIEKNEQWRVMGVQVLVNRLDQIQKKLKGHTMR